MGFNEEVSVYDMIDIIDIPEINSEESCSGGRVSWDSKLHGLGSLSWEASRKQADEENKVESLRKSSTS